MSSRGLYSLSCWLSDPTPRDTRAAVAEVEMACTPFSDFGAYRPRGMLIRLHRVLLLSAGSLYSPKRASLLRLRGTPMQPLLECMRPPAHSAGVRTDLARRSCCRCFTNCHRSVQGRFLLYAVIVVSTWQDSHAAADGAHDASASFRRRRPTPRDVHAAAVSGRKPLPSPVTAVCIDSAGRSFRFTTFHCLSMRGLYPRPWASSVLTALDAHTSAAGVPRAMTPTACVAFSDPSETLTHCLQPVAA